MQSATVGALGWTPTPYPNTLRPMGLTVVDSHHLTMLPPPPTEAGSIFQHRASPSGVIQAIILSYQVDKDADQPYKPEADTTLAEAITHLDRRGFILIHGGRIDSTLDSSLYHLRMWESQVIHPINRDEVVELLDCNYPSSPAPMVEEPDTIPCPPPAPELVPGVGLWCQDYYGVDIDTIHPDKWQAITFPPGIHHQALYVGDVEIDDRMADVWWSIPLGCYLAQYIPLSELR